MKSRKQLVSMTIAALSAVSILPVSSTQIFAAEEVILEKGIDFNNDIRELAGETIINHKWDFEDKNKDITGFKRSLKPPAAEVITRDITESNNGAAVAWFNENDKTVYWYSTADTVKLNADSKKMFEGLYSAEIIDLSGFDSSRVTNMDRMFQYCSNVKQLDLEKLDTSNVTSMSSVFQNCYELQSNGFGKWNTAHVKDFSKMFSYNKFIKMNLSGWDLSDAVNMEGMFENCKDLTQLMLGNGNSKKLKALTDIFKNCQNLVSMDISSLNTFNVLDMKNLFSNLTSLQRVELGKEFYFKDSKLPFNHIDQRTGRWVKDNENDHVHALSPEELSKKYDGSAMAGLWVLEKEQYIEGHLSVRPVIVLYGEDGEFVRKGNLSEFKDDISKLSVLFTAYAMGGNPQYRKALNANINWDGTSDELSAVLSLPEDFSYCGIYTYRKTYDGPTLMAHSDDQNQIKAILKNGHECKLWFEKGTIRPNIYKLEANGNDVSTDDVVICLTPIPNGTNLKDSARLYFDKSSVERGSVDNLNLEFTIPTFEITDQFLKKANRSTVLTVPGYGISLNRVPGIDHIPDEGEDYSWGISKEEGKSEVQKKVETFVDQWEVYIDGEKLTEDQYGSVFYKNHNMFDRIRNDDKGVFGPYVNLIWLNVNGYGGKTIKIVMPCTLNESFTVDGYIHSTSSFDELYYNDKATVKKLISTSAAGYQKITQRFAGTASVKVYDPVNSEIPSIEKKITGEAPSAMPSFQIDLVNAIYIPEEGDNEQAEVVKPEKEYILFQGAGTADFGSLRFSRPGTYVYEFCENTDEKTTDWIYDDSHYVVTYQVTSDDTGKLSIESMVITDKETDNPVSNIVFNNTYNKPKLRMVIAEPLQVEKKLIGDVSQSKESFKFDLQKEGQVIQTIEISGSGAKSFDALSFDQPGIFSYTIKELNGNEENWIYDEKVYDIVYSVTEKDGRLELDHSITTDKKKVDSIVFTNIYNPPVSEDYRPASDILEVQKVITGNIIKENDEFEFEMVPESKENPMPQISTITIIGQGTKDFGELKFDHPGTYVYKVKEINKETVGYKYDESVYTVTYEVSATSKGGSKLLEYVRTIEKNGVLADKISFTNHYIVPGEDAKTGLGIDKGKLAGISLISAGIMISLGLLYFRRKRK